MAPGMRGKLNPTSGDRQCQCDRTFLSRMNGEMWDYDGDHWPGRTMRCCVLKLGNWNRGGQKWKASEAGGNHHPVTPSHNLSVHPLTANLRIRKTSFIYDQPQKESTYITTMPLDMSSTKEASSSHQPKEPSCQVPRRRSSLSLARQLPVMPPSSTGNKHLCGF